MRNGAALEFVRLVGDVSRSSLAPLDSAVEYVRVRGDRVLGPYVIAMTPFSIASFLLIDYLTSQYRSALPAGCLLLTAATVWRWVWLGVVQRRVQEDLRGDPPLPLRKRLAGILMIRLLTNLAVTWGGIVIVPMFYGFFASAFVTPLLLESNEPAYSRLLRALGWIHRSAGRLIRISVAFTVAGMLATMCMATSHYLLIYIVLEKLFALDTSDVTLTVTGAAWMMCMGYFLFLLFDFFWSVASVILFYDLQSRKLGTDLRLRLRQLRERN